MKKSITTLFVVIIAFAAQANYVNWTMSKINSLTDASGSAVLTTSNYSSFTAYLVDSTLAGDSLTAAIMDGTLANSARETTTLRSFSGVRVNWAASNSKTDYVYDEGQTTYSLYTVIVGTVGDTTYYLTSDVKSASVTGENANLAMEWGDVSTSGWKWQSIGSDVPEPTSGLLLLVGGALLALRRKQK